MRRRSFAILPFLVIACLPADAQDPVPKEGHKKAFLVGNGSYSVLPRLPFVPKDLQAVENALTRTGFKVTSLDNANSNDFLERVDRFVKALEPGDVFVFYFSGYAVQATVDGQQGNYMLPTDFDPVKSKQTVFDDFAYPLKRLQGEASHQKLGLMVIVLDASWSVDIDVPGTALGMMPAQPGEGVESLLAFAAQPGQTVELPVDGGGLFSRAFAKRILEPLELLRLFSAVQKDVADASNGLQEPAYSSKVTHEFFFTAPKKPDPELGRPLQNPGDHMDYVWIPSGTFKMGCVPGSKCEPNERPQHPVTLTKSFWMGKTEVTIESYKRYVNMDKKNRRMPEAPLWDKKFRENTHPITSVSWEGARNYCAWAGGRLPTDAEWEYAARGRSEDQIFPLNDENSRDKANFDGTKGADIWDTTSPVGSFDPSPTFRLYDMAGNVWEWVNDWYSATYDTDSAVTDPPGPSAGREHVARGGSFNSDPKEHLRISFRKSFKKPENNVGFRCVLDDTPEVRQHLGTP
jgi:formylglycine-generating enzyme required for sulfatase activity